MDQREPRGEADQARSMTARTTDSVTADPAIVDPTEHNIVFTSLVTGDKDIVGLVAYSIYKQNKYDWLQAYSRLRGRMPDTAEARSYLLGESTPRRLAIYRHLAEAVLDGRGPDVPGASDGSTTRGVDPRRIAAEGPLPRSNFIPLTKAGRGGFQLSARMIVGLCIALGVLLVLLWMLHSNAPLPPPTPAR